MNTIDNSRSPQLLDVYQEQLQLILSGKSHSNISPSAPISASTNPNPNPTLTPTPYNTAQSIIGLTSALQQAKLQNSTTFHTHQISSTATAKLQADNAQLMNTSRHSRAVTGRIR